MPEPSDSERLHGFLARLPSVASEEVAWLRGALRLRQQLYLTAELPPLELVTSVRALLSSSAGWAVLHNADGVHVLPGGRREAGESIEQTLRRELREETGCRVRSSQLLGVLHFHHLTPKPAQYPYPYPDFLQLVFLARGEPEPGFDGDPESYEQRVQFVAAEVLEELELPAVQRCLLTAALQIVT